MIIAFFWENKQPMVAHRTPTGRKLDGGYGLPHVQSMIKTYRIKCGLQIISTRKSATWKFYSFITTASKLRCFAPHLWSNTIPRIDEGDTLFHQTAETTYRKAIRWWKIGISPNRQVHLLADHLPTPVCKKRVKHLDKLPLFQILHSSNLTVAVLDF
jgi:hypothetical protein